MRACLAAIVEQQSLLLCSGRLPLYFLQLTFIDLQSAIVLKLQVHQSLRSHNVVGLEVGNGIAQPNPLQPLEDNGPSSRGSRCCHGRGWPTG